MELIGSKLMGNNEIENKLRICRDRYAMFLFGKMRANGSFPWTWQAETVSKIWPSMRVAHEYYPIAYATSLFAEVYCDKGSPLCREETILNAAVKGFKKVCTIQQEDGWFPPDPNSQMFYMPPLLHARNKLSNFLDSETLAKWDAHLKRGLKRLIKCDVRPGYVNIRMLKALALWMGYTIYDDRLWLDECLSALDPSARYQFPSGAYAYDGSGLWIWGIRPSLSYQSFVGIILYVIGHALGRQDFIERALRVAKFTLHFITEGGEVLENVYESAYKTNSVGLPMMYHILFSRLAAVEEDPEFQYVAEKCLRKFIEHQREDGSFTPRIGGGGMASISDYLVSFQFFFNDLAANYPKNISLQKTKPRFEGVKFFPDLSTVIVKIPGLHLVTSLLGGYSSLSQIVWHDLHLSAAGPEIAGGRNYLNFGISSVRDQWDVNKELKFSSIEEDRAIIQGLVPTMGTPNERMLLDVAIIYLEKVLFLAVLSDKKVDENYQFTFLVEASPLDIEPLKLDVNGLLLQIDGKKMVGQNLLEDETYNCKIGPIVTRRSGEYFLVINPLVSSANRLVVEAVHSRSEKARFRNDVRLVFKDYQEKAMDVFAIEMLNHDLSPEVQKEKIEFGRKLIKKMYPSIL